MLLGIGGLGIVSPLRPITGAPAGPVTWDPASSGRHITLSNGNLTAMAGGTNGPDTVITTIGRSAGKRFYEVTVSSWGDPLWGPVPGFSKVPLPDNFLGNTDSGNSIGFQSDGSISFLEDVAAETWSGYVGGDTIGFALDIATRRLWIIINGLVDGGGDPVTGTLPTYTLPPEMSGLLFPGFSTGNAGDAATADFSGAGAPAGFSGW